MATTLTPTALVVDTASVTLPIASATAFTDATTIQVAYPREGKLLLVINSTYAGANTVVVGAGEYLGTGVGSYTITTAQNGVYYVLLSSARFKTFDGILSITFGTSNTGFIMGLSLPY